MQELETQHTMCFGGVGRSAGESKREKCCWWEKSKTEQLHEILISPSSKDLAENAREYMEISTDKGVDKVWENNWELKQ